MVRSSLVRIAVMHSARLAKVAAHTAVTFQSSRLSGQLLKALRSAQVRHINACCQH